LRHGLLSIALGVPLAWATARSDMPLRKTVHALVALSYITPPYLTALAYIILMGPDAGHFNRLLRWSLDRRARRSIYSP
jgi:iron(III) transport system permease protein